MENASKIRILITNDDGFMASSIRALATALSAVGEVYVFAPETEQSGVSQAFTVRKPLRIQQVPGEFPFKFYSVSGTPDDCSKFAIGRLSKFGMDDEPAGSFDVCFSGVNKGENSGVSALYSGTVAGAREACLWGVPGIALSLRGSTEDMLPVAIDFAVSVVKNRVFESIAPGTFWNVNFPKGVPSEFKGFKATTMAHGMFTDHYDEKDADDGSRAKFWSLDGDKLWNEAPVDSDDYLLHQGYATITPHRIDQTDYESLKVINKEINGKAVGGGL